MTEKAEKTELLPREEVEEAAGQCRLVLDAVNQVILGKPHLSRLLFAAVLARGHVLLEGLPGLGKTVLAKSFAAALDLKFSRVQFTPDLLPADITGSYMLEEGAAGRAMTFYPGPVFTNLLLADEINRASPKTQSALLEAMSEGQVTQLGNTMTLDTPFSVLATQNPIELEGTYPLPEAQLDRFAVKIDIDSADQAVLKEIITTRKDGLPKLPSPVIDLDKVRGLQSMVEKIHLPHAMAEHISSLVANTNPGTKDAPPEVDLLVRYGASPRAAIWIAQVSKALALLDGRPGVGFEDVRECGPPVLGHRIILQHAARLDGETGRGLAARLIKANEERIVGA
jgi:MoxR-like ATPase